MATSPKDKFDAAVKVIRGLPKNGSFQPSHELMLKFYSYFKQATEGPCKSPKPGFWDVVNRKKWDAWAKLGSMEAEEAMLLYVDELKNVSKFVREVYYPPEIVETMPQTDDVSEFLQKLENFYEMVEDSDNHNSLKIYNKESPPPTDNGKMDLPPLDQSLNSSPDIDSEFEHSQGLTRLLQQDIRWWQDRTGVMRAHKSNGDISSNRKSETPHRPLNGSNGGDKEEERVNSNLQVTEEKLSEARLPDMAGSEILEEWEEIEARASNSGSHSGHSGGSFSESETENEEEFCDTSDEPAEPFHHPQEVSMVAATPHLSAQLMSAATSTPMKTGNTLVAAASTSVAPTTTTTASGSGAKSVHFDEPDIAPTVAPETNVSPSRQKISESLLVNPSPQAGNILDLSASSDSGGRMEATVSLGNQTMVWDSAYDAGVGTPGRMDISVCRGGEGEEVDRDRHSRRGAAGRGGREAAMSGRGGGNHAGGADGAGSRRGLFPGPGGGGGGGRGGPVVSMEDRGPADLNEQIVVTLLRLQHDMSGVLNRLNSLEALVKEGRAEKEKRAKAARGWWPLSELSMKSALLIFGWPILLHVVLFYISRRRKHHAR
ncbi:acyl-CoA-binding domain-containing protein 5 [Plakobranchus ocellatus]|uniref:Acyl-CoA-binding domain-containing protein 5 n=1 Tax=Plakobranchus ocellatus TaxID=259542 RepID=A0AAV4DEE8_9GAST|nr:acyl-CoA-binding domain-containing protein 5 [Plakobranchus ocellatus]